MILNSFNFLKLLVSWWKPQLEVKLFLFCLALNGKETFPCAQIYHSWGSIHSSNRLIKHSCASSNWYSAPPIYRSSLHDSRCS
jgi:hypothetical protein